MLKLQYLLAACKEALWLLLKPQRLPRPFSCIVMVAVYYPPGQAAINEITMIDYLTDGIDFILQSYPSAGIIIAGDFNKMKLGTLCNCFDLRKIVKKPTRQNNNLDQIMTNMSPLAVSRSATSSSLRSIGSPMPPFESKTSNEYMPNN